MHSRGLHRATCTCYVRYSGFRLGRFRFGRRPTGNHWLHMNCRYCSTPLLPIINGRSPVCTVAEDAAGPSPRCNCIPSVAAGSRFAFTSSLGIIGSNFRPALGVMIPGHLDSREMRLADRRVQVVSSHLISSPQRLCFQPVPWIDMEQWLQVLNFLSVVSALWEVRNLGYTFVSNFVPGKTLDASFPSDGWLVSS